MTDRRRLHRWDAFEFRAGFGQTEGLRGWRVPARLLARGGGAEQRYFVG